MSAERVKFFYDEIKELTKRIGELKLPEFFKKEVESVIQPSWFESEGILSGKGSEELEKVLTDKLKELAPDIYGKMQEIFDAYNEIEEDNDFRPVIFYCKDEDAEPGFFKYDPTEIDPINLCFLMVFGNGAIEEDDIFSDYTEFYPYVAEKDEKLAAFMEEGYPFISFFNLAQFVCRVNRF